MMQSTTPLPQIEQRPWRTRAGTRVGARAVRTAIVLTLTLSACAWSNGASAQTLNEVLTFLLTNRSIPTDDFVRDEQAAAATAATISRFLVTELGTLPISSSAGGFTYRLDPTLGASVRSSDSFGPFFTERSLTAGTRQIAFGLGYQQASFQKIDGRSLRDGTLVATASKLHNDPQLFDMETLTLRMHTDTVTVSANAGITDRLDIGAALPFVHIAFAGQRIDNYRGRLSTQATASGNASGPGDVIVRGKYNAFSSAASGMALGIEARLPTGNKDNLLGTGQATVMPRLIGSLEGGQIGVHGNLGYVFGGFSEGLDYSAALTVAASPRLTLVGEMSGRRLKSIGRLTDTVAPNPSLIGVDTVRLTATNEATERLVAAAGVKWNFRSTWLLSANVFRPLTEAGLTTRWTPTITVDHTFGR
jgi:hypothetical protein